MTDTFTFATDSQAIAPGPDDTIAADIPAVVPGRDDSIRGSQQTTRVAFFTDTHRIIADVETGPRRLVEVLRDVSRAHRVARELRAGVVWVNCFDRGDITAPFGGFKQSGFGRDKSIHALDKYTDLKSIWIAV